MGSLFNNGEEWQKLDQALTMIGNDIVRFCQLVLQLYVIFTKVVTLTEFQYKKWKAVGYFHKKWLEKQILQVIMVQVQINVKINVPGSHKKKLFGMCRIYKYYVIFIYFQAAVLPSVGCLSFVLWKKLEIGCMNIRKFVNSIHIK